MPAAETPRPTSPPPPPQTRPPHQTTLATSFTLGGVAFLMLLARPLAGSLGDIGELLPGYFEECRKRGILTVRVIHGKGTGALREGVHRVLEKLPGVASWTWPAAANYGGWGATWVQLNVSEG